MEKIGLVAIFDVTQFNEGLDDYSQGLNKANDATKDAEKDSFSFVRAMEVFVGNALVKVGELALDLAGKIVEFGKKAIETAVSFESAFAGVTKTTDGLVDSAGNLTEIGVELKEDFRDLAKEVPIAFEELAEIGELGGQLGIERENLIGFTKTIADIGETTNLSTGEAATAFAKFANVMGTSQTDFDNIGSATVFLGNNFATTEKDIINFSQRIAGAGKIAGLTEPDVLGISAAFSSVGVESEAGGTAVQKVLLKMNEAVNDGGKELELFASTAGVSADEFAVLFEENAANAFFNFVAGLGEAGDDATGILDELALKDQRLIKAFLSLGQNSDILKESINGANEAFVENTALTIEAEQRYGTTESKIQILKNSARDLAFSFGDALLPAVSKIIDIFSEVIETHGPNLERVFGIIAESIEIAIETIIITIPKIVETANQIVEWFQNTFKNDMENATEFVAELVTFLTKWFEQTLPKIIVAAEAIVKWFNTRFMPFFRDVLVPIMQDIWELIQSTIRAALIIITELIEVFIALISGDWEAFWDSIMTIAATILAWLIDRTGEVLEILASLFGAMIKKLIENWENAWNQIKLTFELTWKAIVKFMESIGPAMKRLWEGIVEVITTPWEELGPKILSMIQGAVKNIQDWFTNNAHLFVQMGKDIVAGMLKGVQDDIDGLVAFLSGIAGDIIGNFKKALGIGSPSKVFAEIGANVIEGLTLGIAANTNAPSQALMGVAGGMASSVSNIDNSVTNNIEINSTNTPQAPTQIFFDVISALNAVSG